MAQGVHALENAKTTHGHNRRVVKINAAVGSIQTPVSSESESES
jgi:hypothetical protein